MDPGLLTALKASVNWTAAVIAALAGSVFLLAAFRHRVELQEIKVGSAVWALGGLLLFELATFGYYGVGRWHQLMKTGVDLWENYYVTLSLPWAFICLAAFALFPVARLRGYSVWLCFLGVIVAALLIWAGLFLWVLGCC